MLTELVKTKIYVPTHLSGYVRSYLEGKVSGYTCYPEMEGMWEGEQEVVDIYEIIYAMGTDKEWLPGVEKLMKDHGESVVLYTREWVYVSREFYDACTE